MAGPLWALGAFLLLAVAWTWPLARQISWRVPHDPGDPVLNTWILWWNTQALPFTAAWWSPPIFFPMPGAFALSEHLAGIAVFTTPLQLAGVPPLAAYNVALILSSALSGFFTTLLVRRLLERSTATPAVRWTAALLAGVLFGFAPYRAGHLSHLQVLTTQWMPLMLLGMHGYLADGRRRWLWIVAVAWPLQALSNGYYLLFFPVLAALWFAWFVDWRAEWRRGAALLGTFAAASLLLAPALYGYLRIHRGLGLARALTEMRMFSAELTSFLNVPNLLAYWPDAYGSNQEVYLFPGFAGPALVLLALALGRVRRVRRSRFVFYAAAALVMWWLALGPAPPEAPGQALIRPYTLLTLLPGFDGLRVPARIAMLGYLCLAVAAGLAYARLPPWRLPVRAGFLAVLAATVVSDIWTAPMPMAPPPGRVMLPDVPRAAVLELPADDDRVNSAAMYRSIAHGRPLVNGYSGHTPPHYRIFNAALRRGDVTPLLTLARGRPLLVAIHGDRDPGGHFHRVILSAPGVQQMGTTNAGRLYLVPAQPAVDTPPLGPLLSARTHEIAPGTAEIDLGRIAVVRSLRIPIRWRYAELNTQLEILGSTDGQSWRALHLDYTGGPAVAAALEDQRIVPLRITLPDAAVRYLRVRPAPAWMMRELEVYGPGK